MDYTRLVETKLFGFITGLVVLAMPAGLFSLCLVAALFFLAMGQGFFRREFWEAIVPGACITLACVVMWVWLRRFYRQLNLLMRQFMVGLCLLVLALSVFWFCYCLK